MATQKQKAAISKIAENHGNISKSMLEVGYSPNTAKKPQNLTESKGFQQLMEEAGLTDEFLLQKHLELLNAKRGKNIDPMAVKAGLEMGYKLKGSFAPEKGEYKLNMIPIMGGLSVKKEKGGEKV